MGAGFLESFLSCRGLQNFVPRSTENRASQGKKVRVIVNNKYFGLITYISAPYLFIISREQGGVNLFAKTSLFFHDCLL